MRVRPTCAPAPLRPCVSSADAPDHITLRDPLGVGLSPAEPAEDGVPAVEVRLRGEGDEPLAPPGVGPGERHPQHAGVIPTAVDLVADGPPRAARAIPAGIAGLDHEIRDHP